MQERPHIITARELIIITFDFRSFVQDALDLLDTVSYDIPVVASDKDDFILAQVINMKPCDRMWIQIIDARLKVRRRCRWV
jgi:hypothetical protein